MFDFEHCVILSRAKNLSCYSGPSGDPSLSLRVTIDSEVE